MSQPHEEIVDAGHGGEDTGAVGKGGVREKELVLSVVQRVKRYLEAQEATLRKTLTRLGFLRD